MDVRAWDPGAEVPAAGHPDQCLGSAHYRERRAGVRERDVSDCGWCVWVILLVGAACSVVCRVSAYRVSIVLDCLDGLVGIFAQWCDVHGRRRFSDVDFSGLFTRGSFLRIILCISRGVVVEVVRECNGNGGRWLRLFPRCVVQTPHRLRISIHGVIEPCRLDVAVLMCDYGLFRWRSFFNLSLLLPMTVPLAMFKSHLSTVPEGKRDGEFAKDREIRGEGNIWCAVPRWKGS